VEEVWSTVHNAGCKPTAGSRPWKGRWAPTPTSYSLCSQLYWPWEQFTFTFTFYWKQQSHCEDLTKIFQDGDTMSWDYVQDLNDSSQDQGQKLYKLVSSAHESQDKMDGNTVGSRVKMHAIETRWLTWSMLPLNCSRMTSSSFAAWHSKSPPMSVDNSTWHSKHFQGVRNTAISMHVCLLAYIENRTSKLYDIFLAQ